MRLLDFIFKVATINVRGLSRKKFELISDFFHTLQLDFCFIQETMISLESKILSFSADWRGPSYWAPAVGRRGGVAILCSNDYSNAVSVWHKDSSGRILSLLVSLGSFNINLVNVYVPTAPAERKTFLPSIATFFFPNSRPLIGGDFNCFDSALDKMGGTASLDSNFTSFKESCGLRDVWRLLHPRVKQFTWFSPDLSIASRLDSFLLSRLDGDNLGCEIRPCTFSDHEYVILTFDPSNIPLRGRGLWKFNNSLLEDRVFCTNMSSYINDLLAFRHGYSSYREFWEMLKENVKYYIVSYSKHRRRDASRQKVLLTNRLVYLKNMLVSGDRSVQAEILEAEASLLALLNDELEGRKIRSRIKWMEEGETPSSFFLKSENQKFQKHFMSSVWNAEGREVFSLPDLIAAHEYFYSALFSDEPIDDDSQDLLISYISRSLSEEDRELCEGLVTLQELTEALKLMNRNKSPGPDGLTVEFYSLFWESLGPLLVEVLNESYRESELCESMKVSVTRLVHKSDDKRNLKNWRPISLLNLDYKIGSKALSLRLSKVLEGIIDSDQSCSVPNRSIFSNLALLRDTLSYIEWSGEKGILVSLDQEKAFDRVNRSFLMKLLNRFGFGPSFRNWIFTLYHGAYMRILVNDFLTEPVYLHRGVRQGDALSPMLYLLCVEVLAVVIRASPQIEGFLLPGASGLQFKVSQYADDTTVFVKDERSLSTLFEKIALYERGSGAKLNRKKTKAMWLGQWRDRGDEPLGLNWVNKMKLLGIVFGTVNVERDNWEPRISKSEKSLSLWKSRSLSMIGRVLVLNILGLSKLLFVSRVLEPPSWVCVRVNGLIWPFLWGSKIETVARKTIICPLKDGGLGLKEFRLQGRASRLAALYNILNSRGCKAFFLLKYFCGVQLSRIRTEWQDLRDNLTPSATRPTRFYSRLLEALRSLTIPQGFSFSSRAFYSLFLRAVSTVPILPRQWSFFLPKRFSLSAHWSLVRDSFSENCKNDLAWLISLRAVKVRNSLRNWGYINSSQCASCRRVETIDHCFLNCTRVKPVWVYFLPLLTALLSSPFSVNCAFFFFYQLPPLCRKNQRILLYIIKTILL